MRRRDPELQLREERDHSLAVGLLGEVAVSARERTLVQLDPCPRMVSRNKV